MYVLLSFVSCRLIFCNSLHLSSSAHCTNMLYQSMVIVVDFFFPKLVVFKFFQNTGISFAVEHLILRGENNEAITESINIDNEWCRTEKAGKTLNKKFFLPVFISQNVKLMCIHMTYCRIYSLFIHSTRT